MYHMRQVESHSVKIMSGESRKLKLSILLTEPHRIIPTELLI